MVGGRSDKLVEVLHKAHKADTEKLVCLVDQEKKAKVDSMGWLVLLEGKEKKALQELEALKVLLVLLQDIKAGQEDRDLLALRV